MAYSSKYTEEVLKKKKDNYIDSVLNGTYKSEVPTISVKKNTNNAQAKKEKELPWYKKILQKPKVFEDGYQFGDITKTVGGTAADVGMSAAKGIANVGEGLGDAMTYGVAQVHEWTGNKEKANMLRKNASEDLINKAFEKPQSYVNKASVVGDTGDKAAEGVGYMAAIWAGGQVGGLAGTALGSTSKAASIGSTVGQTALTFGNSTGTNMADIYQEYGVDGVNSGEAWAKSLGGAAVETTTEQLFGMFGHADTKLINSMANRAKSSLGKVLIRTGGQAVGEASEEMISYAANYVWDRVVDAASKGEGATFAKQWSWDELWEQAGVAALTAIGSGGGSTSASVINNKTNTNTWSDALNETTRQQDIQAQSENLTNEINKLNKKLPKASDMSQVQEIQNELNWKNKQLNALNRTPGIVGTQNEINKTDIQDNEALPVQDERNTYAIKEQIKQDSENFAKQVDSVKNGTFPKNDMLVLGNTPKVLKDIGLSDLPITMTQKHLDTIMNETGKYKGANYHNLGEDIVKQLPEAINNPLDVVKSNTQDDSIVLTTYLADKNNNTVIASIKIDGKGKVNDIIIDTNVMTSAYGKDNYDKFMKDNIQKGNLLYDIDQGAIKKVTGERLQLPIRSNEISSDAKTRFQLPRISTTTNTINNSITPSNENVNYNNKYAQQTQNDTSNNSNVLPTVKNNVAERARKTENQRKAEEYEKIAEILNKPITKEKEKSRIFAIAKANLIDKGIVFEELSRKAGNNRELQGKWDYTLTAEARGQNAIGNARYERDSKTKTEKQICKSLEDIRKEVGSKTHDFQQYMYHQLNIDRMTLEERFAGDTGINYERKEAVKNKPVFGKSVTAEISKKIVEQYENNNPEFKSWAQDVYDFLDANKKELVDRGVISQELSDKLAEFYPHYVPIKRINAKGMAIKVPLDTNRTGVNSPLAKATGGNSDIQPLFQTIADRTMQTYRASARNNFGVELMNTLNSVTETSKTDIDTILEEIGDTDANQELLKEGKNGNNPTFTVFNNGEKVTFEITKDMYDALKPQSEIIKNINNSKISKVANKVSNFRRAVLTEYNPVFSLTNAIKDVQDVVVNSQHPAKTYAKFPEAYAQIVKKGYWYNEYVQNGGAQNSYFKDGEFTSDKKTTRLKSAIKIPFETISNINNVIEMAPRLAEYIASREAGTSIETAMLNASRVTTNFKAGGDFTKMLNRNGVTFLNASVQGMQQQIRNIQEANTKGLKGYAVLATKYAIAGLPVVLLNGLLWKDDEDYEELQDYVKDNYYIIAKYGDGKFVRIPKGRVSATIQKIVGNATEYITDDKELNIDNVGKDFIEDLKFARDNLVPNSPMNNNILSPIKQVMTNTSWYGEDIVPSRLKDKPAKEQYDESIDSFSIKLGGILGISPYKINYLLDQYGGGVSDIVLPMMTKQAENNMFADKFTTDSVMKSKYPGEFYTSLDELKIKANSSKATDEDIIKYKYISSISSEMSELYNEKREIQNSNVSDKEKKEKLKVVQKEINEIAKEAVKNNSNIKISGNTATINDTQFYKAPSVSDGTMKWNKVSDEEKEKNKNISLKSYADYKNKIANETIKQRKNGIISSEGQLKNKDKIQIVLSSAYTNKEKSAIYENYIKDKDDKKYDIIKSSYTTTDKLNIEKYLQYKLAEANGEFDSDKDDDGTINGKSVYGSAKEKRWSYIENMNITYTQKLILWGLEYTPSDYQQKQIVTYIKAMPNKTQKEKLEILSHFKGFTIYKNGKFSY